MFPTVHGPGTCHTHTPIYPCYFPEHKNHRIFCQTNARYVFVGSRKLRKAKTPQNPKKQKLSNRNSLGRGDESQPLAGFFFCSANCLAPNPNGRCSLLSFGSVFFFQYACLYVPSVFKALPFLYVMPFSRMCSKGSRFTPWVWGLRVCSLDVAVTFATFQPVLYTLHSTLETLHFTLLTPHSSLHTLHSTLHT